jgi:hypothetical protein
LQNFESDDTRFSISTFACHVNSVCKFFIEQVIELLPHLDRRREEGEEEEEEEGRKPSSNAWY